jgi:hydroxymethylbilane synthase
MGGKIIIGTRGSKLALWQSNWVKEKLQHHFPSLYVDISIIQTKGDKILDVPLAKVGGKGLFVKEIEEALLEGRIDLAVHSMKDMPSQLPGGLCIASVPARENPYDVLLSREGSSLMSLSSGSVLGTSSLRRSAQIAHIRPDLEIRPLRGNLDTRLRKLDEGEYDGIVLAAAGVRRLGMEGHISQQFDTDVMLPAVGQGALCIETREDDEEIRNMVSRLEDPETRSAVEAERAFLVTLEGGCQVPLAAHATVKNDIVYLDGLVADLEGVTVYREFCEGPVASARSIGTKLAEDLISMGAREILDKLKSEFYGEA